MRADIRGAVLVAFFLSSLIAPSIPTAGSEFADVESEETYPVGFTDLHWWDGEGESHVGHLYYPANSSGQRTPMANSTGPYPLFVWFGDEGESRTNYGWVGNALASAGYIVVTLPPDWDPDETSDQISDLIWLYYRFNENNINGSDFVYDPDNMEESFDLENWGVGGHGMGATQAAHAQRVLTNGYSEYIRVPPVAMVGLGLDIVDTSLSPTLLGSTPSTPGLALYLTGSVDGKAEPSTNIEDFIETSIDGYHYMEVLGANHLQYQDTEALFESWGDGDATMEKEEQQSHAMAHILPYLNLILKGADDEWIVATNRESDWDFPADENAYVNEDLRTANFFPIVLPPGGGVQETDGESGFESSTLVRFTHRDGTQVENATVRCEIIGYSNTTGVGTSVALPASGPWSEATCSSPIEGVEPGPQKMRLEIDWYGMPSSIFIQFDRENRPPVLSSPLPVINIPQHGVGGLNYSDIATDPDGVPIVVEYLSHTEYGEIGVHPFGDSSYPWDITLWHRGNPEWSGSGILNITIFDTHNTSYQDVVSLQVNVLAVDDPVRQLNAIPDVELVEDGEPITLSLSAYFEDPEAGFVGVESVTPFEGMQFSTNGAMLTISPQPNWNGETMIEIWVSDGTTAPIPAYINVSVISVIDTPILNETSISVVEDTVVDIPLNEIGWDEDGDAVQLQVTGGDGNITFNVLNDVLRIMPNADWSGVSVGWNFSIQSSDGSAWLIRDILVVGVDDPAQVIWSDEPLTLEGVRIPISFAVHDPDDDLPWPVRYRFDNGPWNTIETDCETIGESDWVCDFYVSISGLSEGSHELQAQVADGDNWSSEQSMYFSAPKATNSDAEQEEQSGPSMNSDDGPFSIWIVLTITGIAIILIAGLYMVVALNREDDGLLSEEELEELLDF
ncbi:MAG: Ig-like domain-containing protein [Candidatus Thermoplasmatota archaeon]|nr:Ig-like domain-containing protein [Candidatus Thermoplasmatota archaeon]MEE3082885.1 Ig-like domain-containing protein [Candidatus Thermoplasmatota archaeon]